MRRASKGLRAVANDKTNQVERRKYIKNTVVLNHKGDIQVMETELSLQMTGIRVSQLWR